MPVLATACVLGIAPVAAHAVPALNDGQEDAREAGDNLQLAIPLAAFGLTYLLAAESSGQPTMSGLRFDSETLIHLNGSPRHDLALAMARMTLISQGLKYAVDEKRPNGGMHSFPSGHTAVTFTSAEFIRKEYGWWWGIPAYALASYVGYTRVDAKEHYTHDVLAGALIGVAVNHDWGEVKTRFGMLSLTPALLSMPPPVDHLTTVAPIARAPAPAVAGIEISLQF